MATNNNKTKYKIAIDAFGGDNAPKEIVLGAIDYLKIDSDIDVTLLGIEEKISPILLSTDYDKDRLSIVNCSEVIETDEHPALAIKSKKDSSIVKGLELLANDTFDTFISAGNSGALFLGANHYLKTIEGIKRPIFATYIPTSNSPSLLLDCGANLDPDPMQLMNYGVIGSLYYNIVMNKDKPTVGLLNIGVEETKGNKLVIDTFKLLKDNNNINFIGNVEARDLACGNADVIIADAFSGNIAIKVYEGTAKLLLGELKNVFYKNVITKLGALLIKKNLKKTLTKYNPSNYNAAPLL